MQGKAEERLREERDRFKLPALPHFTFIQFEGDFFTGYVPTGANWASKNNLVVRFGSDGGGGSILTAYVGWRAADVHFNVASDVEEPKPDDTVACAFKALPCDASLLSGHARYFGTHAIQPCAPEGSGEEYIFRRSLNVRYRDPLDSDEGMDQWDDSVNYFHSDFVLEDAMFEGWKAGLSVVLQHYKDNPCILPAYMRREISEYAVLTGDATAKAAAAILANQSGSKTPADLLAANETQAFMAAMLPDMLRKQPTLVPVQRAALRWAPNLLPAGGNA